MLKRNYMRSSTKLLFAVALVLWPGAAEAERLRVATYNLESYLETASGTRPAKSEAGKSKIRESLLTLNPDVLAVQELGGLDALQELQQSLEQAGLNLQHWQLLSGSDTNIHLGVLSRFPFRASRPHTNESYLLDGRRFHVSRGFAEIDIQVNGHYWFTLLAAHLKSKRTSAEADEKAIRLEEALLLREKIDTVLNADANARLVVLGDLNDTRDSESTRTVMGRGKAKLIDTRPAERNCDGSWGGTRQADQRCVTWTHYYGKEDSYRRIDYVLISKRMARDWIAEESYVLAAPDWGLASDHRPLVAVFEVAPP